MKKILFALALWASATQSSDAKELEVSPSWLQFHTADFTGSAEQIPMYSINLHPSGAMTIRFQTYEASGSFEHQVGKNVFTDIDRLLKERWPVGTVQEFQCTSGLDHDVEFKLILSQPGRHVSTAWYHSCLDEKGHEELLFFSNSLRMLLDADSIERELRQRTRDANHQ